MTNQPETETLPMALLVQTGPLLDIYTINDKPFTGIGIVYRGNQNNPFDLSKIKTRTTFKQGRKNGPIERFYKHGQLMYRANYKTGKRDGLEENFFKNGQLKGKGNYKIGKRDGPWEGFHKNGKLKYRGYFKGGRKDSVFDYCDENGQFFLSGSNHESFFVSFFR